ncbi:hypothetical protein [Luteibacter sp.]|jgi:hypothetical protein|uniref:hypothetical protein n=1 Tax=Luteibacter sp. TaxID=1886636 RepID=UPI002F3FD5BD
MLGKVLWFHDELRMALIERAGGFTVGSVESGFLTLGGQVEGDGWHEGPTVLKDLTTQGRVVFLVEADAETEEEANELLGFLRG